MTISNKKRAAIYIRANKDCEMAIHTQFGTCREYALEKGIVLSRVYIDIAPAGEGQVELRTLLKHSKQGDFDHVIVYSIDRIARNLYMYLPIQEELQKLEVTLLSATETEAIRKIRCSGVLEQILEGIVIKAKKDLGDDYYENGIAHQELVYNQKEIWNNVAAQKKGEENE